MDAERSRVLVVLTDAEPEKSFCRSALPQAGHTGARVWFGRTSNSDRFLQPWQW